MIGSDDERSGDAFSRSAHMVGRSGEVIGLGATQARLTARAAEFAVRRRAATSREAKDLHHKIALGAVLTRRGARAKDSWLLDGLLSGTVEEFVARVTRAAARLPGKAAGAVLVGALDDDAAVLDAKGRQAAWRRKYRAYMERYRSWLATHDEFREQGAWRAEPMSAAQAELVRLTAALLAVDLPGELDRGLAHDWIEANGAPLRYRSVPA